MEITAKAVAELRQITGVGMMDCKKVLVEANGDIDKAIKLLNEQGKAKVAKKASRIAGEGLIGVYSHMNGKIVSMCEVNCETDFAAKNPKLMEFARDLAVHVVAFSPKCVKPEELDAEYLKEQREIFKAQVLNEGKPEQIADRIVEGKVNKLYNEVCLVNQAFIKDPEKTVQDILNELTLIVGEKITIRRFIRWEMGEGLEKRNDDFAAEVAAQTKA